jgi:hypothetical protein
VLPGLEGNRKITEEEGNQDVKFSSVTFMMNLKEEYICVSEIAFSVDQD